MSKLEQNMIGIQNILESANSISTEVNDQSDLISQIIDVLENKAAGSDLTPIVDALTEKGVTVPDGTKVDGLAALIAAIEAGGISFSSGRFTPSADIKSEYQISHGLGAIPDIVVIYDTGRYIQTKWATYITIVTANEYGDAYPTHTAQQYGTTQFSFYADGSEYGFDNSTSSYIGVNEDTIAFKPSNAGYLISGRTYSWFAISGVI